MFSKISPAFKLISGVLVLVGLCLFVQRDFHTSRKIFRDSPWSPKLVLKHAAVVGWNHSHRVWEFKSHELWVDHQGKYLTYKGKGIGILFYKNHPFLTIHAPQLIFNLITKSVHASGGVFLKADPSTFLSARQLYWNQNSQQLYVPGRVFVKTACGELEARHLVLMAHDGKVTVLSVRMRIHSNLFFRKGENFILNGSGCRSLLND
ncbi:MAG: hypothetical protein M1169_04860 [Firmicutes bacterium]|nr:hypothetical protein [Bacillota bacterium]